MGSTAPLTHFGGQMSDQGFYTVLARKYRPRRFSELVAQDAIATTLRNALASERVYQAYLFTGPRGVGKTTSARILAKALNCPEATDSDPCGTCSTCLRIAEGRHDDVLEIDGASNNGIQQVRELRESAAYVPKESRFKIYIIDEVHMLSTAAFNGLLKTLEEPPPHVAFIMATTEPQKIPATVQSRCQRFDFKRLAPEEIADRVVHIAAEEGIEIDEEAIYHIARLADGSMRDAQSHLDQLLAFCGEKITGDEAARALGVVPDEHFLACSAFIAKRGADEVFPFVEMLYTDGLDPALFLRGYLEHLRTLIALGLGATPPEVRRMPDALRVSHQEIAAQTPVGDLIRAARIVTESERSIRGAPHPRIELELTLVRLATLTATVDLQEVLGGIATDAPKSTGHAAPQKRRVGPEPSGRARRPFDPRGDLNPAPNRTESRRKSTPSAPVQTSDAVLERSLPEVASSKKSGIEFTPEQIADLPRKLAKRLQGELPFVSAALAKASIEKSDANTLRFVLAPANRSALPRMQGAETVARVAAEAGELLGAVVEIEAVVAEEKGLARARQGRVPGHKPRTREAGELEKIAADEPLVRDVMEHFDVGGC